MTKALVICGPTATGKTSLALKVAKLLSGHTSIFSIDSRQVYPEVKIISGQDIPEDLPSNIHFFGVNLFSANRPANLSDFVNLTREAINDAIQKKHHLIIVGGTGLYLKGLLEDLTDINIPQNEILRNELEKQTVSDLQEKLKAIDPSRFRSLNQSDQNNPRRLIRQIEISLNTAVPKTILPLLKLKLQSIGLLPPKNLPDLIYKRVIKRLEENALEEVTILLKNHPDRSLPIFSTLGIKQILNFLDQKITYDEMVKHWVIDEVNYAKRQMVWFKKQTSIIWYDENTDRSVLADSLVKYLNKK